jgi:glyoxylase-like metal-dependent hydrolase (beta-lactamase superfamily II)
MSRSGTVLAFGIVVAAALIALLPEVASAAKKTAAAEPAFAPVVEESSLGGALTLMQMKDDAQSHVNAILSAGPDGLLLVDHAGNWQTMTCDSAAAIVFEKAIRAHGDGRLRYLINTHWHGDHIGGNERFGKEAIIIAQRHTREMLMARQTPWWFPDGLRALEPVGWPTVVFDNTMSLFMNGEEIQLWHFGPAHSPGDAVVYFTGAKVAHVGDLYHGLDVLSMPTDAEGMMLTLQGIAARLPRDAKIVTGHGGVTDLAEFQRYQRMYTDVLGYVRRQIAAGKSLEAIQNEGLPEPWKTQWKGDARIVPMWFDSMHRSLVGAEAR